MSFCRYCQTGKNMHLAGCKGAYRQMKDARDRAVELRAVDRLTAEARRWWRDRDPTGMSLAQVLDEIERRHGQEATR